MFNANGLFGPEAWRKTHASWDLVFLLDKALDILAGSEASYRKLASFKGIADLVIGHRGDANGGREVCTQVCNYGLDFRLFARPRGSWGREYTPVRDRERGESTDLSVAGGDGVERKRPGDAKRQSSCRGQAQGEAARV